MSVANLTRYTNRARFDGHNYHADMVACNKGLWIKFEEAMEASSNRKYLKDKPAINNKTAQDKLWEVVHKHFCTDDIKYTTSIVKAPTKEIAMKKFNKLASTRIEYPYCYSQITLESVKELKIIS